MLEAWNEDNKVDYTFKNPEDQNERHKSYFILPCEWHGLVHSSSQSLRSNIDSSQLLSRMHQENEIVVDCLPQLLSVHSRSSKASTI